MKVNVFRPTGMSNLLFSIIAQAQIEIAFQLSKTAKILLIIPNDIKANEKKSRENNTREYQKKKKIRAYFQSTQNECV